MKKKTQPMPAPAAAPDPKFEKDVATLARIRAGRPVPRDIVTMLHGDLDAVLSSGDRKANECIFWNLRACSSSVTATQEAGAGRLRMRTAT
jgi:hypothetical protein